MHAQIITSLGRIGLTVACTSLVLLAGCTALWVGAADGRQGVSSSLVQYLYPEGQVPPPQDGRIPQLNVPLRVGLAFVPSQTGSIEGLSEAEKTRLLNATREAFKEREFIADIVVVPDAYLRGRKGFDALDGIARLYSVDVITLVSYDQVSHSDDRKSSFMYWTILGAYIVKGSQHDVQTFVDAAVFDVATRKLLFRAPGVDHLTATSTLVDSAEKMRQARSASFASAMADMGANLSAELELFRTRIKEEQVATVTYKPGSSGGGALGLVGQILLLCVWFCSSRPKRRPQASDCRSNA